MEQIVSQFLLKSLHIILDSRIPSLHPADRSNEYAPASRIRKSDRWFNLVLGDRPAALDNLNFWHRNLSDPMIIDIILVHEGSNSSSVDNIYGNSASRAPSIETVIERWTVHYESPRGTPQANDSLAQKKTYKKLILLLRALYAQMRLLPAYRIFRQLSSSTQSYDFDIIYKVSSFSDPFSRAEEEMMNDYTFSPIEASPGRICLSVSYRKTLSDFNLEPATSLIPRIITDYVGSPATDPLRSFPSSDGGTEAISFPLTGTRPPASSPFQRHSWTSGIHRGAHIAHGSPPTYGSYGSPSPPTDHFAHRAQSYRLSKRTASFDEYQLSPPFSPASSPSPPAHFLGSNPAQQGRLRSGTAPVTIPHPMASGTTRYATPNLSDPYRHSLPPPSPRSSRLDTSSHESPSGIRLYRKPEISRTGESHLGTNSPHAGHKIMRDYRDDSGRFSGLLSSSGSPRIGFSRSSSRLSFQDDLDDGDFSCPFDVDDVETSDSPVSHNLEGKRASEFTSSSPMGTKSQDAAVGVLVRTLRTAPPLRQDPSCYSTHSFKTEQEGGVATASGFFMPRKTTDALEELRSYRDMKDLLLSKSGTRVFTREEA
ncbi:autophagy-related protein 13a [Punica granatum]|uniref:Autophagy-related protein 13 N-terminal domain-containing protein n=2 Tax=Punica granatum TaxID=22663 RepID=A0A218X441_PUNGR|nr:autophagy-related protein 13a [Punica granatum]OWM79704.1 hypothetical protein CDL15_Pgr023116 [Punica granatum]PKI68683.1 hypothetical protein CRG98_010963 [Punica granatum]